MKVILNGKEVELDPQYDDMNNVILPLAEPIKEPGKKIQYMVFD